MKWCRYTANGSTSYGIIEGDTVHEVSGSPFGEHAKTGATHALGDVQLEVPVIPPTFYAAGINYPEHVTWAANKRGHPAQPAQEGRRGLPGPQRPNSPTAMSQSWCPADATEELQYEGELVVGYREAVRPKIHRPGQRGRGAGLRLRLHHRQRRQRADLAAQRPHHVAGQEHRHLQAHGAVDRHRPEPRRPPRHHPRQRPRRWRVRRQPRPSSASATTSAR